MRVDPWWRPLLALFGVGVGDGRAHVSTDEEAVHVRFGFWEHRFPRTHVSRVGPVRSNLLWGIGWHADFRRRLIVNGSLAGLVEVQFALPQRFRLLRLSGRCTHLVLSLEEPADLAQELSPG